MFFLVYLSPSISRSTIYLPLYAAHFTLSHRRIIVVLARTRAQEAELRAADEAARAAEDAERAAREAEAQRLSDAETARVRAEQEVCNGITLRHTYTINPSNHCGLQCTLQCTQASGCILFDCV
jgi:hypothetical protein